MDQTGILLTFLYMLSDFDVDIKLEPSLADNRLWFDFGYQA